MTKRYIVLLISLYITFCNGTKPVWNKLTFSKAIGKQFNKIASLTLAFALPVHANIIGEFETSGFIFKDTLKLNQFNDPKVEGVAIYLADFERPITEKITKDFFSDPSSTSLTCSKSGPITISSDVNKGPSGEEVFQESRNLFFKVLVIIYSISLIIL